MASITLKDLPADLHAILKTEAEANFRSLAQEVMARLQHSVDVDATTKRDQRWIDQALESGPEEPFSNRRFRDALHEGLAKARATPRK